MTEETQPEKELFSAHYNENTNTVSVQVYVDGVVFESGEHNVPVVDGEPINDTAYEQFVHDRVQEASYITTPQEVALVTQVLFLDTLVPVERTEPNTI